MVYRQVGNELRFRKPQIHGSPLPSILPRSGSNIVSDAAASGAEVKVDRAAIGSAISCGFTLRMNVVIFVAIGP